MPPPTTLTMAEVMAITDDLLFLIPVRTAPSATLIATPPHRGPIHRQANGGGILKSLIALGAVQDVDERLPRGRRVRTLAEIVARIITEASLHAGLVEAGGASDRLDGMKRRLAQKLAGQNRPQ